MPNIPPQAKVLIERSSVNSSNIKSIGHNPDANVLEVEFYGRSVIAPGVIWRYWPITQEAYQEMLKSESIGSYFSKNIRNNNMVNQYQM